MKNYAIIPYFNKDYLDYLIEISQQNSHINLPYSLFHLQSSDDFFASDINVAVIKAISICHLIGIESKLHFRKIYVFDDAEKSIKTDYRMSQIGFKLMIMQMKSTSKKGAQLMWQLASN